MNVPRAERLFCLYRGRVEMHRGAVGVILIAGSLAYASPASVASATDSAVRPSPAPSFITHAPGAIAFWILFYGDAPVLGPPRTFKPTDALRDDEIMVEVLPSGMAPYAKVHIVEKTKQPVDFVITGLIDSIKIDEIVICGRLDGDIETKIAAGAKRLSLNRFTARQVGAGCS
jgi:hypothetical protein